jgi:hypothetical protein
VIAQKKCKWDKYNTWKKNSRKSDSKLIRVIRNGLKNKFPHFTSYYLYIYINGSWVHMLPLF